MFGRCCVRYCTRVVTASCLFPPLFSFCFFIVLLIFVLSPIIPLRSLSASFTVRWHVFVGRFPLLDERHSSCKCESRMGLHVRESVANGRLASGGAVSIGGRLTEGSVACVHEVGRS